MSNKNAIKTMAAQLVQRAQLASRAGKTFGGKRNLYDVFGYKTALHYNDFLAKYQRQDVAKRIVDAPAAATWRNPPEIKFVGDTVESSQEFKEAWEALVRKHQLWSTIERADRLAGIGRFSVLLLGFNDTARDKAQVAPNDDNKLLFVQPYSEDSVEIEEIETDTKSPRFGLPKIYRIKVKDVTDSSSVKTPATLQTKDIFVHHSRIVHIAEDPVQDNILGTPRLEPVYNLLDDLLKVAGGSAETYWLAGNRGMQADIDPEAEMDQEDADQLSDELEEYQHELRRWIRTRGVTVKDLGSDVADPSGPFEVIMSLLSGARGIPKRILLGSEVGQLASEQDRSNWADNIRERRIKFAEPSILVPLMKKLMDARVLPQTDMTQMEFIWPPNFQLTPLEEAQMMAQKARAASNMSKHFEQKPLMNVSEARQTLGLDSEAPDDLPDQGEATEGDVVQTPEEEQMDEGQISS